METLVRSLAHIKQLRRQQGLELPKHLCLQCDNTVAQAKNAEVVLGMGMLVRRFAFDTTSLCFLRKGHTHEDVDFVFSILLSKGLEENQDENSTGSGQQHQCHGILSCRKGLQNTIHVAYPLPGLQTMACQLWLYPLTIAFCPDKEQSARTLSLSNVGWI